MAVAVHLNRPPFNAFLAAWGKHETDWWACVTFRARIVGDGEPTIDVAAWVPSHAVTKPAYVNASSVPRVTLSPDRRVWPAPPRWPSWYAGVWPEGPLQLPAGTSLVTGADWRNKRRRARD